MFFQQDVRVLYKYFVPRHTSDASQNDLKALDPFFIQVRCLVPENYLNFHALMNLKAGRGISELVFQKSLPMSSQTKVCRRLLSFFRAVQNPQSENYIKNLSWGKSSLRIEGVRLQVVRSCEAWATGHSELQKFTERVPPNSHIVAYFSMNLERFVTYFKK